MKPQQWEFSPAIADCGLQGTATSPPSTTTTFIPHQHARRELVKRRGWDSNPRDTFGAHALSRRADSTALAPLHTTSPEHDGEGGIRTPGTTRAQLISNQPPSTTRPPLRRNA